MPSAFGVIASAMNRQSSVGSTVAKKPKVQPMSSVTVTLYTSSDSPMAVAVVCPAGSLHTY